MTPARAMLQSVTSTIYTREAMSTGASATTSSSTMQLARDSIPIPIPISAELKLYKRGPHRGEH